MWKPASETVYYAEASTTKAGSLNAEFRDSELGFGTCKLDYTATHSFQKPLLKESTFNHNKKPYMI